jgi:S-adenosylmethionine:tRNA ribosyltransferase-isomerase
MRVAALRAAAWVRPDPAKVRVLRVDPRAGAYSEARVGTLAELFRAGDLLVVNDAATLPASLVGMSSRGPVEVRLAGLPAPDGTAASLTWPAVLFGAGSWRERTEDRPAPPRLAVGDTLGFHRSQSGSAVSLSAVIASVSTLSPRLVELQFDRSGGALWAALYRHGRPVQYSYLCGPLRLAHVQTGYASRPWSMEMPSAGAPLHVPFLRSLRRRGVELASVSHGAGLSATGDQALDAALPLPERSDVPLATVEAVERTRAAGGRVVAVGTTVVRALEGAAERGGGRLLPGVFVTSLRLGPGFHPRVVDGLLSGLHEPGESHFELLRVFAPEPLLRAVVDHAAARGYLAHEFGDLCLMLAE